MKNRIRAVLSMMFTGILSAGAPDKPVLQYLFPPDGAEWVAPESPVIVRFENCGPDQIEKKDLFFSEGSRSGRINGHVIVSDDDRTLIFQPDAPYIDGESVTVRLHAKMKGARTAFLDTVIQFDVSVPAGPVQKIQKVNVTRNRPLSNGTYEVNEDNVVILNGVSVPSDFPYINVSIDNNPDPGYIFCTFTGSRNYDLILDEHGNPVFYWIVPDDRRDFMVQETGVLTMIVRSGFGGGGYIALDNTYTVVDTFFAPPGYEIDEHELLVLANGHYLVTAMDSRIVDMSQLVPGGKRNARVTGYHLIEMDAHDNPVFIWRCWDHYQITDAEYVDLTQSNIDYLHMNSIAVDLDGNYLVNPKLLNEITKINSQTGDIIWRLGGKQNQFETIDFDDFVYMQHAIRVLDNGNYTIFDNGNYHNPPYSRALEFRVDEKAMTVTKVWEFRNSPDRYSPYKGNVQRLPNGNTLINWALTYYPKLTEVTPNGEKVFEMNFDKPVECYRVFKFPWQGKAAVPFLVIESRSDQVILLFNKFGDTDVKNYRIYGDVHPNPTRFLGSATQPYMVVPPEDLQDGSRYYFCVTAVNSAGEESGTSNEENTRVNFVPPNTNLLLNGGFQNQISPWKLTVTGTAEAAAGITGEGVLIDIANGGSELTDIVLSQSGLQLYRGQSYRFEFDARAEESRILDVKVESAGQSTDYSRMGSIYIRTRTEHFAFSFNMQDPTDDNARLAFHTGGDASNVIIDNVSLVRLSGTGIAEKESDGQITGYRLDELYPNPANPVTHVRFSLPEESGFNSTLLTFSDGVCLRSSAARSLQDSMTGPSM